MKITAMTTMIMMAGAVAEGANQRPERNVTVCMEVSVAASVVRSLASSIFAGIGITIDWRPGPRGCPAQGIPISMSYNTPASSLPGALAYALPYEGAHIRVFYDRIARKRELFMVLRVLAHVVVHEITHILQAVDRHSDHGIMKAQWEQDDFENMARKSLAFTDEDIDLIYRGVTARAARAVRVTNAAPAKVASQY